ncbi:MAG: EpsG family protein [Bacteroides sp.]|nr:EpsG family protein [Bacteroides sp.]
MVYLIALIFAILGAVINSRISPTMRKSIFVTLGVYMILIIGFRYKVGVDTLNYMREYRFIPTIDQLFSGDYTVKTRYEPGYLLICSLCKSISSQFWPVQIVISLLTTSGIFIFIYRNCKNIFLGVMFFIILQWLYFTTEILREGVAVSIFLVNYKNLEEKKWGKYVLGCIGSMMFHYSAIITFFFPFVKLLDKKILFYILCICFLGITPLVEKLNDILNIASISGRISWYISGAQNLNLNWRLGELIRSAFPAITVLVINTLYHESPTFKSVLLLQILLCAGAFAIPIIFSRFTNYTTLFVTIASANLISKDHVQIWMKALFISVIILSQSYYLYSMAPHWLPYSSIFYPENYPERRQIYRHAFMPWLKF